MILTINKANTIKAAAQMGHEAKFQALIKEWAEDVAEFAESAFQFEQPVGNTGRMLSATSSTRATRIAGTTFGYEASAGISEIDETRGNDPEEGLYPLYVLKGTGIYGPHADLYGTKGYLPAHGNVMVFEKLGEGPIFTRYVKGQEPNPFFDIVIRETKAYAKVKLRELKAIVKYLL